MVSATGTVTATVPITATGAVSVTGVVSATAEAGGEEEAPPVSEEGTPIKLVGVGEAGTTVQLRIGDQVLGAVEVSDDGTWTWEGTLKPGEYQLVTGTLDEAGNVTSEAPPVLVQVDEEAPGGEDVTSTSGETPPMVGDVLFDEEGNATITGSGQPGTIVKIIEDGNVLGTTKVTEDGSWQFSYMPTAGDHELVVQDASNPDILSPSIKIAALVAEAGDDQDQQAEATVGQAYFVKRGDTLRKIAAKFLGDRDEWRKIWNATNRKARKDPSFRFIRDPNLIQRGWKIWIPPRQPSTGLG
jgi:nucleoid-associated protein YgaU